MDLFEGTNKYLVKLFGQKLMKINFGFIAMTYNEEEFEKEKLFKRFPILMYLRQRRQIHQIRHTSQIRQPRLFAPARWARAIFH